MPTLFTVGNLFCGYSSVVQASLGDLELAALLILAAGILDGIDGRIARLTKTTSAFGMEFDSLADIVSFGIAPAFLAYHWALHPCGRIGWSLAFLYVVCAAMRLARYNIHAGADDKRHFVGLPSPMAGCVLACLVFASPEPPQSGSLAVALAVLVLCVAVLMISRLRYRSFREIDLRNRRPYTFVLPLAAIVVAVVVHPKEVLLVLCSAYLLHPPAAYLSAVWRRRAIDAPPSEVADEPLGP
jgi:CDP-diacylglycerol--serine O-phosphatidyltransferase